MLPLSSSGSQFLYRGVHAGHPSHSAALTGVVVPGNIHGHVTPEQHNLRDSSADSPYTSWTHIREVAVNFGLSKGPGGLLLCVPVGKPGPEDLWSWEYSPDGWMEDEVLLRGVRIGVEVTKL